MSTNNVIKMNQYIVWRLHTRMEEVYRQIYHNSFVLKTNNTFLVEAKTINFLY